MLRPLVLVVLCLAAPASARADDPWWGRDKALHLSVSLGLGGAAYGGLRLTGDAPEARLALAFSLAMLPGLAKEIYDDGQPGNRFSGKDMLWNAVGALAGSALGYVIDRLFRRHVGKRLTSGYWGLVSWDRANCPGAALPD